MGPRRHGMVIPRKRRPPDVEDRIKYIE